MFRVLGHFILLTCLYTLILNSCSSDIQRIKTDVIRLQNEGKFAQVDSMISDFLSENSGIAYGEKRELEFEVERNRRIMNDCHMRLTATVH